MKQIFLKGYSHLTAGLDEGFKKGLLILGYGMLSAGITAAMNYFSNFMITNSTGSVGFVTVTYFVNGTLGFLQKWLSTRPLVVDPNAAYPKPGYIVVDGSDEKVVEV